MFACVHVCRQRRCQRHHRCLTSHFTSFVPRHLTLIFKTPLQVLYRGCGRLQLQDVPKKMWNVTSESFIVEMWFWEGNLQDEHDGVDMGI